MTPMREPAGDIAAQIAAVADPRSKKDAAFVVCGQSVPSVPAGVLAVSRPEGMLVTTNPAKAHALKSADVLHDGMMANLLGYPETKAQAGASGAPVMVQGVAKGGGVAHESAASLAGLADAIRAAQAAVPDGKV